MKNIIILASGSGTNAENIIKYFHPSNAVNITAVYCNKKEAGVYKRVERLSVPCFYFSKKDFENNTLLNEIKEKADWIILAGFLWKIPSLFIEAFPKKIINIHPALLPKYGGKGMYGMHVHRAVKENNDTESGITIHFVDEDYDQGAIIFQARTVLCKEDTPEDIANKIHTLEYVHFPRVIQETIFAND